MQYLYCIILHRGDDYMKKRITFTLDENVIKKLKDVSEKTMIPQARIVEQAITEKIQELERKM